MSACLTWSADCDERGALLRIGRQIDAALRLIGTGVIAARIDALAALAASLVVGAVDAVRTVLRGAFVGVLLAHIDGCWFVSEGNLISFDGIALQFRGRSKVKGV